ncbi:MAG TPA: carbohydrate kinase family protein [Thermoleophilia bacterium]|nr:carbohydrate kinase family protein [Thermoleophilia bacterium]
MRRYDLIGCGALNLDLIYRVEAGSPLWELLPPPGSELAVTPELRASVDAALAGCEPARSGGGQAANTAYALARLGFRSAMLGKIGGDDDGRFLTSELAPCDARFLAVDGESGRVYVLLNDEGERRNLVWPAANDQYVPGDLPRRLPHTRYVYFSSFVGEGPLQTQLALLERLPADVEVAFDPGDLYARLGVKRLMPFFRRAGLVLATESELETMCGLPAERATSFLIDAGVGLVVRKMGDRGAQIVARRLDLYVPPHPAEVVDVTGAGDLFAAGFIGGLLEGLGLESAGRLAAWAASRGIAGLGRSTYPDADAWRERVAEERGEVPA